MKYGFDFVNVKISEFISKRDRIDIRNQKRPISYYRSVKRKKDLRIFNGLIVLNFKSLLAEGDFNDLPRKRKDVTRKTERTSAGTA